MAGIGERAIWAAPEHLQEPLDTVSALQAAFPETGLWPMLTFGNDWASGYPWGPNAEFWGGPDGSPVPIDGGALLYERWRAIYLDEEEGLDEGSEPLRPWPGLLTPSLPGTDREVTPLGGEESWTEDGQLVLVPAARPADVFLTLGPSQYNDRPGHSDLTAILRSWEERYGALPLRFSGDLLVLGIRRPPRTLVESRAAVIEMMALSVDAFNTGDWEAIFDELRGARRWEFWWD